MSRNLDPRPAQGPPPGPGILLALPGEDTTGIASRLCDHGYEVWRSGSIREAANLVASGRRIAAVITALVFPDGNWRDLTDQVRARDPLLPVLLVTRAPTAELWWDAIEGGVSDILSPTFQPSDLEPSLRRLDHD